MSDDRGQMELYEDMLDCYGDVPNDEDADDEDVDDEDVDDEDDQEERLRLLREKFCQPPRTKVRGL